MAEPEKCPTCGAELAEGLHVDQRALTFNLLKANDVAPAFTLRSTPDAQGRRFILHEPFSQDEAARAFADQLNQLLELAQEATP